MPQTKRGLWVDIIYGGAYHVATIFLRLSKLPAIGKPFEALGTRSRLNVVTVPVNVEVQETSAIMPFDAIRRLVEAASYVAMADTCLCRQAHRCKDYPASPGCVYLGEGARTIKYKVREAGKQEALEWLEKARSMGLVTNVIWSSVEFNALGADAARTIEVCSCCPCCCLMFKTRNASKAYIDSIMGFGIARPVGAEECTRCTNCEQSCPFKAIRVDMHDGPLVDPGRCKGCGRCEAVCRAKVLKVFPAGTDGDFSNSCERSSVNTSDYMERFLAMVR
jgi:Pyruvate/2-oxoacid:ferredoxin oxidoreductase delta subunit